MAKLNAAKRNLLSGKSFVFPKTRKYPIEDVAHAKNAKSRASAQGGAVKSKVFAAVKRKYGFASGGPVPSVDSVSDTRVDNALWKLGIKC